MTWISRLALVVVLAGIGVGVALSLTPLTVDGVSCDHFDSSAKAALWDFDEGEASGETGSEAMAGSAARAALIGRMVPACAVAADVRHRHIWWVVGVTGALSLSVRFVGAGVRPRDEWDEPATL
jgi:hypothetical protein